MDLAGAERQRSGPAQASDFAAQRALGPQVAQELPAVVLLEHEHALDAFQRAQEPLRLRRGEEPH
jgi:hypothetical protein